MSTVSPTEKDHVELSLPRKSSDEILQAEIEDGWRELNRPGAGLFLSGLSAGLDVGFSLLLMAGVLSLAGGQLDPLSRKMLLALMYAVGFIFVNLGRSELFTEHTTLMIFPVLAHNVSLRALLRVWGMVYAGNLLGVALFALLVARLGPALGVIKPPAFGEIAMGLIDFRWWVIIASGVLAGWMMGLLSWLVAATQDTMSQMACVGLIAATIGFANLHHCIAGSVEVLAGLFAGQGPTLADYLRFLVLTTTGNILGGAIFASLKYSHATRAHRP